MKADYVTSDALRLLVNTMRPDNGLALRVCLETGLRIGDALKIRPEDISGRVLSYVAEKTGKSGKKTLSPELARLLARNGDERWVFPGRYRSTKTGHRTRQAVYRDLKRVAAKLGVAGQISPHSARKSYAVEEYHKHGLDAVRQELQHDSSAVTAIYALADVISGGGSAGNDPRIDSIVKIVQEIHKIVLDIAEKIG